MSRRWLLALGFALWGSIVQEVEASLRDGDEVTSLLHEALDRALGDNAYELYTYPPARHDPPGFFPLVELTVQDARVGDVPLAYVQITLRSLQLDVEALQRGKLVFRKGAVDRLEAVLTERDLASVLRRQKFAKKVSGLRVKCSRDTVSLTGRTQVGFISPEAKLSGGFEIVDDGRMLVFVPDELSLAGISAGSAASDKVMTRVNPLLDLAEIARKFHLDLRLRDVQVRNGEIRVRG